MEKQAINTRAIGLIGVILVSILFSTLFSLARPALLSKAGPTLPPLVPPAQPNPSGGGDDGDGDDTPVGAYIELQIQPLRAGLWTVVQWQDSDGAWHDVEGWQGTLDPSHYKSWWVARKDFNTGPFRWIVTEGPQGQLLGMSEPFTLPLEANTVVRVEASLGPQ